MTDKNKKLRVNDVILNHDYFKIERVYPIKITKSFISSFSDSEGNFNWIRLIKHRQVNHERGLPLNHGFPIMEEEINEIIKKNSEGKSITELQEYFQRPLKTVANIIENFSNKKNNKATKQSVSFESENKIINSIIRGYDPNTKKPFDLNSVWKNSNILRDLINWSGININKTNESSSKDEEVRTKENKYEKPIPKEINIENVSKKTSALLPKCASCGDLINSGRLKAQPLTKLCINCAPNEKNRKINETWGDRDDWKRDKSSWKRSH